MKKLLLLVCTIGLVAASAARADRAPTHKECVVRFESCEAIIREFQANPEIAIPASVLAKAKAIVITNQFKAGFIFGVKDGYGVIMVKKANGQWSVPALIKAGETSLGLQAGGRTVETVYIFTDEQTPRMIFNQRFNVGADAVAVAGPKEASKEKNNEKMLQAPVLVYTKTKGLFAGASVKAGFLARDDDANRVYYNTTYSLPEILYSDWIAPTADVKPLVDFIKQIAP